VWQTVLKMASDGRNGAGYAKLGGEVGSPKASRKFPGTIRGRLKAWPVRAIDRAIDRS